MLHIHKERWCTAARRAAILLPYYILNRWCIAAARRAAILLPYYVIKRWCIAAASGNTVAILCNKEMVYCGHDNIN